MQRKLINVIKSTMLFLACAFMLTNVVSCQDKDSLYFRDRVAISASDLQSAKSALQNFHSQALFIENFEIKEIGADYQWQIFFSENKLLRFTDGVVESVTNDEKTGIVSILLSDGIVYEFNTQYVKPKDITISTTEPIKLGFGTDCCVEFHVTPSNAMFKYDARNFQHLLRKVDDVLGSVSFEGPVFHSLVDVKPVFNEDGSMKSGHYFATLKDLKKSAEYDEAVSLVLPVRDDQNRDARICSRQITVRGRLSENLVHNKLPIVLVNTPDFEPIESKEIYIPGTEYFSLNLDMTYDFIGEVKIKGRGNSTWGAPKKPYKIKFEEKQSLYGEPKDKEWILLANYYDKSMIRNDLAFWMADKFGKFDYVPRFHFVDLILNGKYNGPYQLGDQLKIGENRVNVGDGGFLLEIDSKAASDEITFKVPHIGQPINIKDPDVVIGDDNYIYVSEYLNKVDAVLFSDNWLDENTGYKTLVDMQSFVEWYLMMEITKNNDAAFFTSCYMHLSRDGKLKMGPIWDFDASLGGYWPGLGRDFINDPEDFYIKTESGAWIARLFEDPAFVKAVKDSFASYYNNQLSINAHIDSVAQANLLSVIANNKLWGTLCSRKSHDEEVEKAYFEQIDYLKNWLSSRLEWLKTAFEAL